MGGFCQPSSRQGRDNRCYLGCYGTESALLLPAQNTHPVRDTCDFEHKRTTPTGSPPQPPPPRPRPIGAIRSIALTIAFRGRWPRVDRSRAATLHGHSDLCVGHTSYHLPTCPTTFEICRFHSTRRAGARATTFVRMFCRIINVVFHICVAMILLVWGGSSARDGFDRLYVSYYVSSSL